MRPSGSRFGSRFGSRLRSVRWLRLVRWLSPVLGLVVCLGAAHLWIRHAATATPPQIGAPSGVVRHEPGGVRVFGASRVRHRGKILEVHLTGTPVQIGFAHARLLHAEMVRNEGVLLGHFERSIPNSWARALLLDLALLKYGKVQQGMSGERLREIAATARGFDPDPFRDFFATFQRFTYLNALYDIALSFEHSPLIGCTSFVLNAGSPNPEVNAGVNGQGDPLLARNFDFEVDPIFDREKAVFVVREQGKVPFASVAWPGLVGVVTGMNAHGVAVVVHGARAAEPTNVGEPVVHALRRVLSNATDTAHAIKLLGLNTAMVSHIVVVMDSSGTAKVVERAPGHADHVSALGSRAAITNHFEGPLAADPKNLRVLEETSTRQRRQRADALLERSQGKPASVADAIAFLRDRKGADGRSLSLGDRNAIDALIATHGVVMNTRRRQLWVSEGPHLLGRFVLFDLEDLFTGPDSSIAELVTLPSDPALESAEVRRYLAGQ